MFGFGYLKKNLFVFSLSKSPRFGPQNFFFGSNCLSWCVLNTHKISINNIHTHHLAITNFKSPAPFYNIKVSPIENTYSPSRELRLLKVKCIMYNMYPIMSQLTGFLIGEYIIIIYGGPSPFSSGYYRASKNGFWGQKKP